MLTNPHIGSALMITKKISLGLLLAVSSCLAIAVAANEPTAMSKNSSPSMQMHAAMMDMQGMKMTGNVDKDFAAMMAVHHRQAIRMAEIEIAHGKSPELKAMAAKMRKDQAAEIKKLERFK